MPRARSLKKILPITVALLCVAGLGAHYAYRHILAPQLAAWVAGEAFNRMLSDAVSHALKVDGNFGPLTLGPDLAVTAESFHSTGWPGQAIGGLQTTQAKGWFNPWAILARKWQVDLISIDRADFRVVTPNDALKAQDPVPGPKPWFSFLMPQQFYCRWIECPDMQIELPVGTDNVRGSNLHVGATMIGKNFKYFGRNGTLFYPGYQPMAIDALEVYVTREMIDIGYLYLREPSSARSNLQLSLRLGQHADRSIRASATIDRLDLQPFLPTDIDAILSGRLSGQITYATDPSGGQASGQGTLSLDDTVLQNWEYLDRLARRSGNEALRRIAFSQVRLDYAMEGDLIRVTNLVVQGQEQIDLQGTGTWNVATSDASASLVARRIPLGGYLPPTIAGRMQGEISGQIDWAWNRTNIAAGRGQGALRLDGTKLEGFAFQKFLVRFLKNDTYQRLALSEARCEWRQDDTGLYLENIFALVPGKAGLGGQVHVAPDGKLSGTVRAGLPASSLGWLPEATTTVFAREEQGLYWCEIELSGTEKKPRNNFTAQIMRQLEKHPTALAELTLRGLSWWLGDIFRHQEG